MLFKEVIPVYSLLWESYKTQNAQLLIVRVIFVMERAGTPFRKFFLERTQSGTGFRIFSPDIDLTFLFPTKFWTTMCSGTYLLVIFKVSGTYASQWALNG
jgi:hypothetical protein